MISKNIRGWNMRMTGGGDPTVRDLLVRREVREGEGVTFTSAWEPTPKELDILNRGGHVTITLLNIHPPIYLGAEEREDNEEREET